MIVAGGGLLLGVLLAADCRHCPTPQPDADLAPARAALAEAYAGAGICPPCEDALLSQAARAVAARSGSSLPEPVLLQRIVQEAGGGDPSPRAMLVSGRDPQAVASALDQQWRPQPTDEVAGLGLTRRPGGTRLVLLSAERKISVDPLPARVSPGTEVRIQGTLLAALHSPVVYVEGPNGKVAQITPALSGARFSARFEPNAPGRFAVEVLAQGVRGPEVLFLKAVAVGSFGAGEGPTGEELAGVDDSAAVLEQINRERQRSDAPALALDGRLNRVAEAYAKELRELRIFAHVSPRSGDLKARLKRAGYRFRSAAENLAEGPTALEAQALTANSPAHRRAMLDPEYTRCGVGLSRAISGEGVADVLLVEVFALDKP